MKPVATLLPMLLIALMAAVGCEGGPDRADVSTGAGGAWPAEVRRAVDAYVQFDIRAGQDAQTRVRGAEDCAAMLNALPRSRRLGEVEDARFVAATLDRLAHSHEAFNRLRQRLSDIAGAPKSLREVISAMGPLEAALKKLAAAEAPSSCEFVQRWRAGKWRAVALASAEQSYIRRSGVDVKRVRRANEIIFSQVASLVQQGLDDAAAIRVAESASLLELAPIRTEK